MDGNRAKISSSGKMGKQGDSSGGVRKNGYSGQRSAPFLGNKELRVSKNRFRLGFYPIIFPRVSICLFSPL